MDVGQTPLVLRAYAREPVERTPVWLMRQAGRSLPSYRALREKHRFLDLLKQPDLIAQITLTPFDYLEVDAAIMFADIMLPLEALGVAFDIVESVGPVVEEPIRTGESVAKLRSDPVAEVVPSVFEAIKVVRKELKPEIALIGFSGAPFTLASYLIEGRPTREFVHTKRLMLGDEKTWHALMSRLVDLVVEYLSEQVDAGVQAVQLFDSWVGALSPGQFERYVLPHTKKVFSAIKPLGVPRIHFGTSTAGILEQMASPDCEAVGVDWRVRLDEAWKRIGFEKAIQGNLDPAILLGPPEVIEEEALDVLKRAGGRPGHVFNLGHGVLPDSPVESIQRLVEVVHEYRFE